MKRNIFKQALAVGLSVLMVSSFAACDSGEAPFDLEGGDPDDLPDEITMMADTVMTFENGLNDVCDEYYKNTGIKLSIEKPDHAKYYEKVTLSFASENPADIIEMGSTYYPEMANSGALWDMTDAWDNSTSNCKKITDEAYVDALKIDGHLYGFPMAKGNGTITYVRGDWLQEAGLDAPKNYDEFINMLRAFKNRGEGTIPLTAAGLINSETPYDIYLREFYQDAVPDFYKDASGKYVDGFSEPAMVAAITRMRDAYAEGLIDAEVTTNKTSTCRDKLGSGLVGAFNYWAGMWAPKLERTLNKGYLTPIPPIEETEYIERVPTALAMTIYADKKAAVFEHFLMYGHDGGEGQMLFTHGVKDKHYIIKDDGSYEALPYYEDPSTPVEKSMFAPELSYTSWDDPFPVDERVSNSLEIFQNNREFATVPIVTDAISENLADLQVVKEQVISSAVTGKWTVDEAMEYYSTKGAYYVNAILDDLNSDSDE
jgi:putative aldouronate transport system substrate-binding protein